MFGTRIAAFAAALAAASAAPAAAFDVGPVAYSTSEGDSKLATIMPDGSDYRLLVPGSQPAWSPDGRWLAYSIDDTEIWRVRPDGTQAQRIAGGSAAQPAWSPNGRRLAFTVTRYDYEYATEHPSVVVAGRDGSRRRVLRRGADSPTWSPDGRLIAMVIGDEKQKLAIVRPNGRGFRVLRSGLPTLASVPQFSPDGRWLLFLTYTDDDATVAATRTNLVRVRTGALRRIPAGKMRGLPSDVTWAPDGKIAFLQHGWTRDDGIDLRTPTRLRTIRRDGSHVQTLTELPASAEAGGGLSWRAG